jgi:GH24 family phage-related lysozyme (muramidase)
VALTGKRRWGRGFICIAITIGAAAGCTLGDKDRQPPGILVEELRAIDRSTSGDRAQLRGIFAPGIELIKRSEGFIAKPYDDPVGYCTIAYGHLIKLRRCDGSEPATWLQGISVADGTTLLVSDLALAEAAVARHIASSVQLSDGQYAALCDFVFNVGAGNFKSSTLLVRITSGDFRDVPYQLRRWTKAKGKILTGLVKRREGEVELWLGSEYDPNVRAGGEPGTEELIDLAIGETK